MMPGLGSVLLITVRSIFNLSYNHKYNLKYYLTPYPPSTVIMLPVTHLLASESK